MFLIPNGAETLLAENLKQNFNSMFFIVRKFEGKVFQWNVSK